MGRGGLLEFCFEGHARSAFLRNRIGLCVLHPIKECAGQRCRIQDGEGSWREDVFPFFISPHQPFKKLQALSWNPSSGVQAEIRFEGEVFEMEDQRNWTDASFKTYSTPLELPFPVEVAAGERIFQRVVLSLMAYETATTNAVDEPCITLTRPSRSWTKLLPKLGVGVASHGLPLSTRERQRLARLCLNHLRVDIHFSRADWKTALRQAQDEANAIGSRLQCALFLNNSAERCLSDFREMIGPDVVEWCLIFHEAEKSTSSPWFELAERSLAPHGFRLATGTNAYFAELNRQRPPRNAVVCYSFNPQVHAFDDLSLIETLEAQPATVQSALQFCDQGLILSPITLRPRFNPNATSSSQEPAGQLPSTVDPRHRTLFGAAWTLGTLSRLLPLDHVESLTFYETTGWRGLMETEEGSANFQQFGSTPGEIFPVYHVFAALAGAQSLLAVTVSDPRRIAALAFSDGDGRSTCLLANLTGAIQRIELDCLTSGLRISGIDEANLPGAREGRSPAWHPLVTAPERVAFSLSPNELVKLAFP
jgi:D-apionolactonase